MKTMARNFKFDPITIEQMDELIANPPAILLDSRRGAPRNRTELIERLVEHAHSLMTTPADTNASNTRQNGGKSGSSRKSA